MFGDHQRIAEVEGRRFDGPAQEPQRIVEKVSVSGEAPIVNAVSPEQLESLLGAPPHRISLLVVTHCHSDHIGCLPAMVATGTIVVDDALVADEALGFGRSVPDGADAAPHPDGLSETVRRVVAALREEPRGINETDEELQTFLVAADNLESGYGEMLATLAAAGTNVIRYQGQALAALQEKYRALGFQVFGPTKEHLEVCAQAIARYQRDAADIVRGLGGDAVGANAVALYRNLLLSGLSDAEDRPGKGAALNDQSIVFSVAEEGRKVLLVGDMQFAKPEIGGLSDPMRVLRESIRAAGPYVLVKTAHHTSYNGLDESVLAEYAGSPLLVHSGGSDDGGHPDAGALQVLRNANGLGGFARTDHNGLITCDLTGQQLEVEIEAGDLNDFTPNSEDPIRLEPAELPLAEPAPVLPVPPPVAAVRQRVADGVVEVTARVPHQATKVTLTIQIEPLAAAPAPNGGDRRVLPPIPPRANLPRPSADLVLAGGRPLPRLLFVTSSAALGKRIGSSAANEIIAALRRQGRAVIDSIPDAQQTPDAALATVKLELGKGGYEGVVLLGGYDVVPAVRLDALDQELRAQLPAQTGDSDNFIVWSDAEYGDSDGDGLPELAVSRVPDGGSADFFRAVLAGQPLGAGSSSFGVRNRERPFADGVYQLLQSPGQMLRSEPSTPREIRRDSLTAANLYFMLHGSDRDATRFWGEDDEGACEAINLRNLPERLSGTVFTGCCWGALIVEQPALYQRADSPPQSRTPGDSLALSFLRAGARAFVGCTGSHYSPTVTPYGYFGGPLHTAFWRELLAGKPPPEALFNAKVAFLRGLPHGRSHAIEVAIELKLYHEYTCLGLGW